METTRTLVEGDCLEAMGRMEPASFDLILCDLPYGVTKLRWDRKIPFPELWERYSRVLKPGGTVALFCSQPFTTDVIASNRKMFRYVWYWKKNIPSGFANAKKRPMKCVEEVAIFSERAPRYNPVGLRLRDKPKKKLARNNWEGLGDAFKEDSLHTVTGYPWNLLEFPLDRTGAHPTQKPVALCEYLVRTYTDEGGTVLDNCAGSGTTGVACANLGRNCVMVESDPGYCAKIRAALGI